MATTRWLWFCSILTAVTLAGALHGTARADADDEARARYERALSLYEDGVYDAALVELRRAYELRPSYKLLYNIGQVRLALKDYAGALEAYQQYLRDGGGQIPAARVEAVQKEMARLEQRVARLDVQVDVAGAEVSVDDVSVGTSPLAGPLLVNSGTRRLTVRHPDYPQQTVRVSIAGGEQKGVPISLAGRAPDATRAAAAPPTPAKAAAEGVPKAAAAPVAVATRTDDVAQRQRARVTSWVSWGVTGALGLTAIGLAAGANQNEKKLDEARNEVGVTAQEKQNELNALKDKTDRLAISADVFTGVAAAAAGVSLWLSLRARPRDPAKDTGSRTHVDVGLARVQLRTEF